MKFADAAWLVLAVLSFAFPTAAVSDSPPSSLRIPPSASFPGPLLSQAPALADVLARAASRAAALADSTRVVTCEERYVQKLSKLRAIVGYEYSGPVGSRSEVTAAPLDGREWVAELAVLGTPSNEPFGFPWMEFRDVVSVDGKPVGDGVSRLKVLQTDPSDAAGIKAVQYSGEAGRHVFGRLVRAVDLPRAAFVILHASNQPRFEFKKGGEKVVGGVRTWEIRFKEKTKPTMIRASGGKDSISSGSFWIDPETGNVVMSLLKSPDSSDFYDEQTVTYQEAPGTGLWLPSGLKERVVDDEAGLRVEASATFTNWRVVPRGKKRP